MIFEIYILSSSGDCILTRRYNNSLKENFREVFWNNLTKGDPLVCPPFFVLKDVMYAYILRQGVYFGAAAPVDTTPVFVIDLLVRFHQLVKDFCGAASEATLRSNVILITEVLNEFIDSGCIQLSATSKLKPYIQTTPVTPRLVEGTVPSLFGVEYRVASPNAAERSVIQSKTGHDQRKNEVFVDVIERLTIAFSADGQVQRCELCGEVKLRSFLSGQPLLKIMLNEDLDIANQDSALGPSSQIGYGKTVNLSRCSFHESAKLDKSRTLCIYPPDGQFTVMSYGITGELPNSLPFRVKSFIKENDSTSRDVELSLSLHCEIPAHSQALNVLVRIPVPPTTTSITQQLSGAARGHKAQLLSSNQKSIEWKLQEINGTAEESAHFKLIGARLIGDGYRQAVGPISVDFEVSGFVCSNLQIRGLKVFDRDTSYIPIKWLRYITTADSYVIKLF